MYRKLSVVILCSVLLGFGRQRESLGERNNARLTGVTQSQDQSATPAGAMKSIREFGVLPTNSAEKNRDALQAAIDWASARGAALFVEPTDEPYPVAGGLVLRMNASLIGVHGPVGRGTRHQTKPQPVGSVFRIEDWEKPFITVESATQCVGFSSGTLPRHSPIQQGSSSTCPPSRFHTHVPHKGSRYLL